MMETSLLRLNLVVICRPGGYYASKVASSIEDLVPAGYHLYFQISSLYVVPPLRMSESPASKTAIVEHL